MQRVDKRRLDVLLLERGLFPTREAARRAIMAGLVSYKSERLTKPGTMVAADIVLDVKQPEHGYVSRGGLKLEKALRVFGVSCADRVVLDIGASTGGFTDCALQHGARHVYAVDVGYGQLAWKLRNDERVTVWERTNFRHIDPARFSVHPDLTVMDVSFISTKLLFSKITEICGEGADVISLIKPQFEAGREYIGKGGIIRDPEVHLRVLLDMLSTIESIGWSCRGLDFSPISGGDGNIEFLAWYQLVPDPLTTAAQRDRARNVVESAWASIKGEDVFPTDRRP